jgi:hypothetical protein
MTSRSEPAGGEKLAVDRVLAPYVLCTAAGLDASTVIPPEHVPVGLGDGLVVVGVGLGLVVVGVGLGEDPEPDRGRGVAVAPLLGAVPRPK